MKAIEIKNLSKTYQGKKRQKVVALDGLCLDVEPGEVFGYLGPNGAGKSTTIKCLMGLIQPSAGVANIFGQSVSSPLARKRVGFLPENPAFYDYLSAEEYLGFVGKVFGMDGAELQHRIEGVLQLLDLGEARKRRIRSYSKGMVQRLGLAQVLVHDPDVFILDEPMSGLDPVGRALVKEIILDLKAKGKTVFFSTHITSDVEQVCDRVGIITKGVLRQVETVQHILSKGITGFRIRVQGDETTKVVKSEDLQAFIAKAQSLNQEITLIEPERKNLEDFFLEIVRSKSE